MLTYVLALVVAFGGIPRVHQDTLPPDLRRGRALLEDGQIEDALHAAERYTFRHAHDPRGFMLLGDVFAQRSFGRFRAIRAYQSASRLAPDDPEPSYRIALVGLDLGGADGEALASGRLARVVELDPYYRDAWHRWLQLYRGDAARDDMIRKLAEHGSAPSIEVRIARLLIEEERYDEAASRLDSALDRDPDNPMYLALRAQGALEAGDTTVGLAYYHRAVAHAAEDSTDALWSQIVGIASPAEAQTWESGVAPELRSAWLEAFWARRNPDLFADVNLRIFEHFQRLRYARRTYPLPHTLTLYDRSAAFRGLQMVPSDNEKQLYFQCELRNTPLAFRIQSPYETEPGQSEIGKDIGVTASYRHYDIGMMPGATAHMGYNRTTNLDDRGIVYLRFGAPERSLIGADNAENPDCDRILFDLERWYYPDVGEIRFARPVGFSDFTGPPVNRMVFRPMDWPQYEATQIAMTNDATSEPAPLKFGVWVASFRHPADHALTDLVVVSTTGALAANLVRTRTGPGDVSRSESGAVTLTAAPGIAWLVADARAGGELGRQDLTVTLRDYSAPPAVSALLLGRPWPTARVTRSGMIDHVQRDLRFAAGATVRTYSELYGLAVSAGHVQYHAAYSVFRTSDVSADYEKSDWPGATKFQFDRDAEASPDGVTVETLDIEPRWLPPGVYLLRLEVRDSVARRVVGRLTTMFEVGK